MARSNARLVRFAFFALLLVLSAYILSKGSSTSYAVSNSNTNSNSKASTPNSVADLKQSLNKNSGGSSSSPASASAGKKIVSGDKVKATFVTLARNSDVWEILGSIREIEDRFNHQFHYDWVFLNDEEFSEEFKRETSRLVTGTTHYGLIPHEQWSFPDWIDTTKAAETRERMRQEKVIYGDSISYRHMCRYESGFFFRHPLMEQFDYYWRVEPGIKIHCDIDYDIFKFMKDNDYEYSYTISLPEYQATIPTLWETTRQFLKENPQYLDQNNFMDWLSDDGGVTYNGCHFWSNFEIGKLSFWRSEAYLSYFEFLDKAGGFFYERWGDAPVHSIAVGLFMDKKKIHFFDDLGYYHVPFNNCPVNEQTRLEKRCTCNPSDDVTFKNYFCNNKFYKLQGLKKPEGWEKYGG
jgi:alpha 1,2-mannosyltransferase